MQWQVSPRHRYPAGLVTALILLIGAILLSLVLGARPMSLHTAWTALTSSVPSPEHSTMWDSRVPRTLLGLLAGVAMGLSGALMQTLTRNPLADPGILGINAGGAFCVVLAVGFLGLTSPQEYIWFAFAGALIVTAMTYALARSGRGGVDPIRLVLAGASLTAVLAGAGEGLSLLAPEAFDRLQAWSVGSLDASSLDAPRIALPFLVLGGVLAFLSARGLDALALGDEAAAALGFRASRIRALATLAVALLAGSVGATVGALTFVGLMVPHLARFFVGANSARLLLMSTLLGPSLLLIADVVGRLIVPGEMAAGVVVAFVGAPFLIDLALRPKVMDL